MAVTSAREAILRAVRAARPQPVALPDVARLTVPNTIATSDLADRFAEAARGAGADVIVATRSDVPSLVAAMVTPAIRVLSSVDDVASTIALPDDPRALAELDIFVAEGVLGVAENGAVWLPASRLAVRAGLFLATRVVLLLDRTAIVPDLHAAYAILDIAAEPFGAFVAGPSKTADIEQSLVVGAHGPKALTVLVYA